MTRPSSSTAIASLLGPVYWIMAKGRFTGLGQGAGLTEGPVYRIIAKGRFTRRAGLPDYSKGPVYWKGRLTPAWLGLARRAGLPRGPAAARYCFPIWVVYT